MANLTYNRCPTNAVIMQQLPNINGEAINGSLWSTIIQMIDDSYNNIITVTRTNFNQFESTFVNAKCLFVDYNDDHSPKFQNLYQIRPSFSEMKIIFQNGANAKAENQKLIIVFYDINGGRRYQGDFHLYFADPINNTLPPTLSGTLFPLF